MWKTERSVLSVMALISMALAFSSVSELEKKSWGEGVKPKPSEDSGNTGAVSNATEILKKFLAHEPLRNPYNGHWYALTKNRLNWLEARKEAVSLEFQGVHGHLATITTAEENDWIYRTLPLGKERAYWLAGRQSPSGPEPDGGWHWITGEKWEWSNWSGVQPDDCPYQETENCLEFWPAGGGWNDVRESWDEQPSIVEFESPDPLAEVRRKHPLQYRPTVQSTTTPAKTPQTPPAWLAETAILNPTNGHLYIVSSTPQTWLRSKKVAAGFSIDGKVGYLATIGSAEESDWVRAHLPLDKDRSYWIGGARDPQSEKHEEGWYWITGEPWDYSKWETGNPDEDPNPFSETCVMLSPEGGGWNDVKDSPERELPFIVEFEQAHPSLFPHEPRLPFMDESPEVRTQHFRELVESDPFDPRVPEYLRWIKRRVMAASSPDPTAQKVKQLIRERLHEDPNPTIAWSLAEIIQSQLLDTDPRSGPDEGTGKTYRREDPSENFETLEEALHLTFRLSEAGSGLWRKSGASLARLNLLRGDWDRVNAVLTEIGSAPVREEDIPWLAPPNPIEAGSQDIWRSCNRDMRSGNSGLRVRVVDEEGGLKGAQIIIRQPDPPESGFDSGFSPTNPFGWAEVVEIRGSRFSRQLGTDARFGVTNESGEVVFENLPKVPVEVHVMVPNGVLPNDWSRAEIVGASGWTPVELKEGDTVDYPTLKVRQVWSLNHPDGEPIDKDSFVLEWPVFSTPSGGNAKYELCLRRFYPNEEIIERASQIVEGNSWPVGKRSVGDLKVVPGSRYLIGVSVLDESGKTFARIDSISFWVPWGYRESDASFTGPLVPDLPYLSSKKRWNGKDDYSRDPVDERMLSTKRRFEEFFKQHPNSFEFEPARVLWAWYEWHDGQKEMAEKELRRLANDLPEGSVPQVAASKLVASLDAGKGLPLELILRG